jgi:hypothetical protein
MIRNNIFIQTHTSIHEDNTFNDMYWCMKLTFDKSFTKKLWHPKTKKEDNKHV